MNEDNLLNAMWELSEENYDGESEARYYTNSTLRSLAVKLGQEFAEKWSALESRNRGWLLFWKAVPGA